MGFSERWGLLVATTGDFLMSMDIWDATALKFIDNKGGPASRLPFHAGEHEGDP